MLTTILLLALLFASGMVGMAIQLRTAVRDTQLDDIEAAAGASAHLLIFSGAQPANCAAADPSGLLATIALPADWMAAASGGTKAKAGVWSAVASGGAGATPASWRIKETAETTCFMQGSAGIGSGDLSFDGTITAGQTITVNTFTLTGGGA